MEAVSPKFTTKNGHWIADIINFWEAFDHLFKLDSRNLSCGCHIHVAPRTRSYTLEELKTIAYAVVIYEKHIREFMKPERRGKHYCRTNTTLSPSLIRIFDPGTNRDTYSQFARELRAITTKETLCAFMQGEERRVIWNFRNIVPNGIGTVEFRGGPQLHTSQETIRWIMFAVGFIELALNEVCGQPLQCPARR